MRFIVFPLGVLILILAGGIGFFNLKPDMEMVHLIPPILTILILFFSIYQQKIFRNTEQTFRNTEQNLQDKLSAKNKEVESLQQTFRRTEQTFQQVEERLRDQLFKSLQEQTLRSPFNYQSEWWQDYSWLYRHVKDWRCEACNLSLNSDRQYLHTHHINGTLYNDPKDLKALCIACHSEQPGTNHKKLTTKPDYDEFIKKYGEQRKLMKSHS